MLQSLFCLLLMPENERQHYIFTTCIWGILAHLRYFSLSACLELCPSYCTLYPTGLWAQHCEDFLAISDARCSTCACCRHSPAGRAWGARRLLPALMAFLKQPDGIGQVTVRAGHQPAFGHSAVVKAHFVCETREILVLGGPRLISRQTEGLLFSRNVPALSRTPRGRHPARTHHLLTGAVTQHRSHSAWAQMGNKKSFLYSAQWRASETLPFLCFSQPLSFRLHYVLCCLFAPFPAWQGRCCIPSGSNTS